jgi:hypothetical protein
MACAVVAAYAMGLVLIFCNSTIKKLLLSLQLAAELAKLV